jgi:hypothetical protein
MSILLNFVFNRNEVVVGLVKGVFPGLGPFTESNEKLIGVGLLDLVQGPVLDLENHKTDIIAVE